MFDIAKMATVTILIAGATQVSRKTHTAAAAIQTKLTLGQPIQVGSLAIVPIESNVPLAKDKYLTLAEATKLGLVEIVEMPGQEEVNSLEVRNKANLPILLFAGELVLGGKQDRIVAKDSIVPAHERRDVPVFCVEHGRWEGKPVFSSGDTLVSDEVRSAALSSADQTVVWASVAKSNSRVAAAPATGTFRGTLDSPKVKAQSNRILSSLNSHFIPTARTVGVICWINGKIESADIYANASLFAQSRSKLLHSYALDASVESNSKTIPVDLKACQAFLKQIVSARRQMTANSNYGRTYNVTGKDLSGYESGNVQFSGGIAGGRGMGSPGAGAAGFGHGTYKPGKNSGGN